MWQRFSLDRRRLAPYLGAVVAGCAGQLEPLVPVDAIAVERPAVLEWSAPTTPSGQVVHRFKWLYRDGRQSAGGRGSARLAAPDSVRVDARGPLGQGRSSGVVVGDSILWAEPEDNLIEAAPNVALMWALFGVARAPDPGAELLGIERPGFIAWRIVAGPDTLEYVREHERRRVRAELRRGGEVVGRTEATFDQAGRLRESRLTVPGVPARLDLTFLESDPASEPFAPDIWLPDRP
jgi:hypothetical protein